MITSACAPATNVHQLACNALRLVSEKTIPKEWRSALLSIWNALICAAWRWHAWRAAIVGSKTFLPFACRHATSVLTNVRSTRWRIARPVLAVAGIARMCAPARQLSSGLAGSRGPPLVVKTSSSRSTRRCWDSSAPNLPRRAKRPEASKRVVRGPSFA